LLDGGVSALSSSLISLGFLLPTQLTDFVTNFERSGTCGSATLGAYRRDVSVEEAAQSLGSSFDHQHATDGDVAECRHRLASRRSTMCRSGHQKRLAGPETGPA
jgi:hypothetical protein